MFPTFWTNVEQSIRDLTALATLFQMIVFRWPTVGLLKGWELWDEATMRRQLTD